MDIVAAAEESVFEEVQRDIITNMILASNKNKIDKQKH